MGRVYNLTSKSGKIISILVVESAHNPRVIIIESPGGFIETKDKIANANKILIKYCRMNLLNYIAIDFSNNGTRRDQPVTQLKFSNRVKDLETVIDFAKKRYNSPLILLGSSLGGFVTLNASTYSKSIKGIILNCAAVKAHICIKNLSLHHNLKLWRDKNEDEVLGFNMPYEFYQDLVSLDATKIISKIKVPILWFHGTSDKIVPIAQAYEAKKLNKNIELVEINGGGHRFGNRMRLGEWDKKVQEFIYKI